MTEQQTAEQFWEGIYRQTSPDTAAGNFAVVGGNLGESH